MTESATLAAIRHPFWAKCSVCNHCWIAAYAPMELTRFAKALKGCHCPMCGADSKSVLIAKQDRGVLQEAAA